MNKHQEAELESVLDGYERRDERRQREIDDRHRASKSSIVDVAPLRHGRER